jgi:NAD+-dependent protein deacetylase sirtuin 5
VLKSEPNAAHITLARFSLPEARHAVAPESTFTLITQNVDGLSKDALQSLGLPERALVVPPMSGDDALTYLRGTEQPILAEMHGRVLDALCMSCGHREVNDTSPIVPALAGTEELTEAGVTEPMIPVEDLPHCTKCGSLTRPGVVWFEELPYGLGAIDQLVRKADLCIVVGTSSKVSGMKRVLAAMII